MRVRCGRCAGRFAFGLALWPRRRLPLRGDGDGARAAAGWDGWQGGVGGGPDRGHRALTEVDHVGGLPVRGDRDGASVAAGWDVRVGVVEVVAKLAPLGRVNVQGTQAGRGDPADV